MTVNRVAALAATAAFVVAVIVGLYLAGSPGEQRLITLDNRRVSDLCKLSNSIEAYWQKHRSLPERLDARLGGDEQKITDPETGHPYEYEVTADNAYRLCAEFGRQSDEPEVTYYCEQGTAFWRHDAGRHCFAFDLAESN